jgi:hypothetical protein
LIRGKFIGNWPIIAGFISLPRLGLGPALLLFLLDTGADQMMIHPAGAALLGVKFATHFKGVPQITVPGVGTAAAWLEDYELYLPHIDGKIDTYKGKAIMAKPTPNNAKHPNLLGRDTFDHYAIAYHKAKNQLELHS